jgi:hypothetical protein
MLEYIASVLTSGEVRARLHKPLGTFSSQCEDNRKWKVAQNSYGIEEEAMTLFELVLSNIPKGKEGGRWRLC